MFQVGTDRWLLGFAISADGKFIYFTPLSSRDLYRVETSALRGNTNNDTQAFLKAADSVQYLGEVRIHEIGMKFPGLTYDL
jgi:hypothetical protein